MVDELVRTPTAAHLLQQPAEHETSGEGLQGTFEHDEPNVTNRCGTCTLRCAGREEHMLTNPRIGLCVSLALAVACSSDFQETVAPARDAGQGGSPARDAAMASGGSSVSDASVGSGGADRDAGGGDEMASRGGAGGRFLLDGAPCAIDPPGTADVDLATVCSLGKIDCTAPLEQLLSGYVCTPGTVPFPSGGFIQLSRKVGCGRETIGWNGGYGGPSYTFEQATGKLIGATVSSDASFGPCNVFRYVAPPPETDGCSSEEEYVCTPGTAVDGGVGPLVGCRGPTNPGCNLCCTYDAAGDTCIERSGTDWYNVTTSAAGPCRVGCAACAACMDRDEQELHTLGYRADCDCTLQYGPDPCFAPGSCGCFCWEFNRLSTLCAGIPR